MFVVYDGKFVIQEEMSEHIVAQDHGLSLVFIIRGIHK